MTATLRELAPGRVPGVVRLNLGCGRNVQPGWVNIDMARLPGVDLIADLNECRRVPLPYADDSVDQFLLCHTLEHIQDSLGLMQELHRVAKPGANCVIHVPYGSSDDAFEDPTHVRQYFLNSFGYFSQPFYWRADYGYRGDWQTERIELRVPKALTQNTTAQLLLARVNSERNVVSEMVATLRAVKPIREPKRELQAPAHITFIGV